MSHLSARGIRYRPSARVIDKVGDFEIRARFEARNAGQNDTNEQHAGKLVQRRCRGCKGWRRRSTPRALVKGGATTIVLLRIFGGVETKEVSLNCIEK
jgi:hypothetical protein